MSAAEFSRSFRFPLIDQSSWLRRELASKLDSRRERILGGRDDAAIGICSEGAGDDVVMPLNCEESGNELGSDGG